MAVNKNSVSYMKNYLKYAVEFEKYVYIWSRAMSEANQRMQQIYDNRKRPITSINLNKPQALHYESEAARHRKKAKKALTVTLILLFLLFLFGASFGYSTVQVPDETFPLSKGLIVLGLGLAVMFFGSLTGILPIGLGIYFSHKSKAKRFEEDARKASGSASNRWQEIILRSQENDAEQRRIANDIEESVICQQQDEIHSALIAAKNNLAQVYAENVLPQKYRNLSAVATLYEYLETGRCNTIQGHGGIFDTYEIEKLHIAQLEQMMQMNRTLSRIEDNQRYICRELQKANYALSNICSSLSEIEKTNAEIARNTAISATANQQTAASAQWIAWRAWANGY